MGSGLTVTNAEVGMPAQPAAVGCGRFDASDALWIDLRERAAMREGFLLGIIVLATAVASAYIFKFWRQTRYGQARLTSPHPGNDCVQESQIAAAAGWSIG